MTYYLIIINLGSTPWDLTSTIVPYLKSIMPSNLIYKISIRNVGIEFGSKLKRF